MNSDRLAYGYLGISEGDTSINAVVIGTDGEVYCIPVDKHEADILVAWDKAGREAYLPTLLDEFDWELSELMLFGTPLPEDTDEDPDQLRFAFDASGKVN